MSGKSQTKRVKFYVLLSKSVLLVQGGSMGLQGGIVATDLAKAVAWGSTWSTLYHSMTEVSYYMLRAHAH